YCIYFFFLLAPPPRRSTLFPYTTLFRSYWLALRERYDLAARNPDVLAAVTAPLKSRPSVHIVDLACGSGSTARALHAHLPARQRSEEHTSELQSLRHLVCRLLLEKKKKE